jgi:hypothetical protein
MQTRSFHAVAAGSLAHLVRSPSNGRGGQIARANTRDSVRKGCGTCPCVIPETALCVIFVAEEGASAVPGEGEA